MYDDNYFFDDRMLNEWVFCKHPEEFRPLGNEKLLKLCDFLSSYDVYQQLIIDGYTGEELENYLWTEECNDRKKFTCYQRLAEYSHDLCLAAQIYTYFKKIIDDADIFPMESFLGLSMGLCGFQLTEEEKKQIADKERKKYFANRDREMKKPKSKKTKKKKSEPKNLPENVISLSAYKKRKSA